MWLCVFFLNGYTTTSYWLLCVFAALPLLTAAAGCVARFALLAKRACWYYTVPVLLLYDTSRGTVYQVYILYILYCLFFTYMYVARTVRILMRNHYYR